jgi:hypothetical protein
VARRFAELAPRLFADLVETGAVPASADRARSEWDGFALYACVRALVQAGGFNRETAAAIDALHEAALGPAAAEPLVDVRARLAERYAEYGAIGRASEALGDDAVTLRLGEAAARHMTAPAPPPPDLAELVGSLHAGLVEALATVLREERP